MTKNGTSRRHFFLGTLLAGAVPVGGFGSVASLKQMGYKSPNEKLNYAAIGAGGKGYTDIMGCKSENFVAMADPDEKRAERTFQLYPNVPKYKDFRQMLDKENKNIDAVLVSCPDFMHGTAAMWAMSRGKHVYCQKPLTHTVWEAHELTAAARKYKVASQMGNQGYSNEGARQCCEIIWNGDIGNVTEVHAWTNRPLSYWKQGPDVIPTEAAVPSTLDWDVWQGISAERPYSPAYVPHNWRGFPSYGAGPIGDMACHILGTPNMALRLSNLISVECVKQIGKSQYTYPQQSVLRYDFGPRDSMPAVKVFWYDSLTKRPDFPGVSPDELLGDSDCNGSLFIGDKGMLTTGCYGERTRLVPVSKMDDYKLPDPVLTRSPGHYRDWIRACKGGEPSCSNFDVAGPFVEWMLLGAIAMILNTKLEWDAQTMQITNHKEANNYLKPTFRKGWKFV